MKIAVVSSGNIPSNWANSINTTKHANGFWALGHKVEIFSPLRFYENKTLKKIKDVNTFYDINSSIKINLLKDYLPFYFNIKKIKNILYNKKLRGIFDIEKKIALFIVNNKYDIAYCRSFKAPLHLIKNKIPTVIETHASKIENQELKNLLSLSNSPYFLGISTISNKIKYLFMEYGVPPQKILVQEDAVDISKFDKIESSKDKLRQELSLPINKKIITYCGSLRSGKGIGDLIKLAEEINNNEVILIIGGPEERKKYFQKISKLKKTNNIIFTGFVENNIVPKYLKASDILIMLYNKNESNSIMDYSTTSPIKLFEYMASKVPIIATKISTIEKIVKNNQEVIFTKMGDIKDVRQKINTILQNKKLMLSLGNNAYKLAKRCTYKKRCENIINHFYVK